MELGAVTERTSHLALKQELPTKMPEYAEIRSGGDKTGKSKKELARRKAIKNSRKINR